MIVLLHPSYYTYIQFFLCHRIDYTDEFSTTVVISSEQLMIDINHTNSSAMI